MPPLSPYRSLPAERRVALVAYEIKTQREARSIFIQRLVGRGGGFRPASFQNWPAERLAQEVVRLKVESAQDELGLMQTLYVDLEPAIQSTFLDAAGVKHDKGRIDENAEPPFCSADSVKTAADAAIAQHGDDGVRYLRTIHRYASESWPGLEDVIAALEPPSAA
ncbi:MAG: hypothetical protein H7099_05425 [Gemmatimonadaceae bacterium]|nr:hypothetical protein [Gemmatimonadaceae bacterium]